MDKFRFVLGVKKLYLILKEYFRYVFMNSDLRKEILILVELFLVTKKINFDTSKNLKCFLLPVYLLIIFFLFIAIFAFLM